MTKKTIYVAYDRDIVDTICAASTMDRAIQLTMRYMFAHDYQCTDFSYDDSYTIIECERIYRIGPDIKRDEITITIMETNFYEEDE